MSTVQVESYPAIIGGERVNAGRTFEVLDPSTGRPCAEVTRCGEAEINQAVEAAREAISYAGTMKSWPGLRAWTPASP
jgi:aldehyde dehydrogenase (NAD+)